MDVAVLAVELGQFCFEVRAHLPHDLFESVQVRAGEHFVPVFRDEDQVCVEHENTMPACSDI
jgi:hypothetical protein